MEEAQRVEGATGATGSDAARKRVAVEMVAKHGRALRRTARRFSICAEDAEDAFQRALEILLTKAPAGDAGELIRWMQTVTKHEALAIRRSRERQLGSPRPPAGGNRRLGRPDPRRFPWPGRTGGEARGDGPQPVSSPISA
jgi:DNA-directed RNA polymerase specialized sigma24 family protein